MNDDIREAVRQRYARAITSKGSCCGSAPAGCCDPLDQACQVITEGLYQPEELEGLPPGLVAASFGCGNPTALAELYAGEVVLDLGSGAGLDVLLSARRVGPHGKAYGLDMTEEMLAAARKNQAQAGITNAEFILGHLEEIPLPEGAVDVIISNCVINLAADKDRVLREGFRVLRPGGRLAISDIVLCRPLPARVQQDLAAWTGCVAGALSEQDYRNKLAAAGFVDIDLEIIRVYDLTNPLAKQLLPGLSDSERRELNGAIVSAFIRGKKPARRLVPGVDFQLRPASDADLPEVLALLEGCGLSTAGVAENRRSFLVADDGSIIGVIGMETAGRSVLLRSLAVRADRRKAGVAAALLEQGLQRSRESGAREAYLLTKTAVKYFARWGFNTVERSCIPGELLRNSALDRVCTGATAMRRKLQ